jgi:hypothetical protein
MGIPQHSNCYSPEPTYGYNVPGTISVATEVTNDSHDSLDLPPHHYGSYTATPANSSIDYDNFYDNNTNTNNTQSQRNHYGNVRNESPGPNHSTEQHGTYYSGTVHSPGAYDVARNGDSGPVYSSDYYGSAYGNDYGPAQHIWSSVPPTVASRRNTKCCNPDYDAARRKLTCSPSVPSPVTMDGKSLANKEGEPYYDPTLWKRPSSSSVPSLATMDSKSLNCVEDESHSIKTEESFDYPELGKADSFENMMHVLEKEDNSCDVWTWLKDI